MSRDQNKPSSSLLRRDTLTFGVGLAGSALGCGDDTDGSGAGGSASNVGGSGGSGGSAGTGAGGSGAAGAGGSGAGGAGGIGGTGGVGGTGGTGAGDPTCTSGADLTPEELLAGIDTIVVLCMENRSFDHYFGSLRFIEGRMDVAGLLGTETNPAPDASSIQVFKLDDFTVEDPPHGWDEVHAQWNGGLNDGFVIAHAGATQNEVMGYHVREQLPVLYALADGSAICDRWFASVLGPTWPTRFYLHGGTSEGQQGNLPNFGFTTIFDQLDDIAVSHVNYYHDVAWALGAHGQFSGLAGIETFFDDAAAGTLPSFSIIDPHFFGNGANDDHPDHDITLGQVLIAAVYEALAQSPQWAKCLFIITYDEHGGFFDHVAPPVASDDEPEFQQHGFRVPSLVIGPQVRKGCVVSTTLEHSSIAKTISTRFGVPPLTTRVASANDISSCIQPEFIDDPQPPITLPMMTVSMAQLLSRPDDSRAHPELRAALDAMKAPQHLDRRDRSHEITRMLLAHAERLGVARVVP